MNGTNASTGKFLTGLDHLRQSITDILTTPVGTRVLNREYGSRLFELVDAPVNADFKMQIYKETREALDKWEPRITVTRVALEVVQAGQLVLSLTAQDVSTGEAGIIDGIIIA